MTLLSLKPSLTLLITGFIVGLCFSLLFRGCGNGDPENLPGHTIISVKDLQKEATGKEAVYIQKISSLEEINQQLQDELKSTDKQLSALKEKTKMRENKIQKLIASKDDAVSKQTVAPEKITMLKGMPAKDLLEKVKQPVATSSNPNPCDSLAQEVSQYVQENGLKDSLYEAQINTLDSVVTVKDFIIGFKTQLHSEWVGVFTKALEQQDILQKENQQLQKQFKRQKRKSRFVTIGAILISTIGTNYLLHH